MTDVIRIEGQYYIRSTSSMADSRTLVLKHDETFAVFDRHGDIHPVGYGEQGVFYEGTRFLSRLILTIDEQRPLLLSSTVRQNNSMIQVDLTNPDLGDDNQPRVFQDTLHILRSKFLWHGVCYERLHLNNFGSSAISFRLGIDVGADFSDIFEVRGQHRPLRGHLDEPVVRHDRLSLTYTGLDNVTRTVSITTTPAPTSIEQQQLCFDITINSREEQIIDICVACQIEQGNEPLGLEQAMIAANSWLAEERADCIEIHTSNEQFNDWLNQSLEDILMLTSDLDTGPYPYAGIPWFSTAFGRDGIITALQTLWAYPELARGVLRFLAATQATEVDPVSDAEPGKILHETRGGEMAALGEIPFGLYYGSVDSTPLFVVLAGRYFEVTADRDLIESIWPNIERALNWIDTYADLDGDGFVEYQRKEDSGLLNQGWKDSHDSVFHADGSTAEPPIAICEMQGYVYAARRAAGTLARVLGHHQRGDELHIQAEVLKEQFNARFWDEELGTYILALDGHGKPCRVPASNAGHALFSGIATEEHAQRIAQTLFSEESYSGWGIRTVSSAASRYNPMSYHNGSIWPHDNAMIADGLARYGRQDLAADVMTGLFDASIFMELHRLPELFCGFPRRPGEGPTLYPVACMPQAWAAGAVFMLLSACLGMRHDMPNNRLSFYRTLLPPYLNHVRLRHLRLGSSTLDISFHRYPDDVGISVTHRDGPIEVVAIK